MINRKSTSYNKACSTKADSKNPLKKAHCVANKLFFVIDDDIARHLGINEYDSWLEQILTDDGILLRKYQPFKLQEPEIK